MPPRSRARGLARATPASARIGRDEERHGRRAERRGEVHEPGVDADDELGAREQRRRVPAASAAAARLRAGLPAASRSLRARSSVAAPGQQRREAGAARSAAISARQCASGHSLSARLVACTKTA